MTKAAEGGPSFVQRNSDGSAISRQWVAGIARILGTMPGEEENEGTPQKRQTRGIVRTTNSKGAYACLGGACGHGCGALNAGDDRGIQCAILHMALGDTQVGWRVREAVQHMHAMPWYEKPKVRKSPEVCAFRQVASPTMRAKMIGKSDWEVVQRAFAPFNPVMYPEDGCLVVHPKGGQQVCYQPFDMPMVHIECHDDKATIENTELVVFRKEHSGETRAAFWQRIVRDSEDRSEQVKCASGSITVAKARPSRCKSVDPNRPLRGSFWSSAASQAEGLGVARECEHIVLNRYNAIRYKGNTLASPAFGDVYCKPRDADEPQFVQRVLNQARAATIEVMGPPPPAEVKPRSLSASFGASADSAYQESVVVEAPDASGGTG